MPGSNVVVRERYRLTCDVVSIEDFGGVFELTGGLSWDASLKTTGISLRLAPGTVGGFILYFLSTSSSTSRWPSLSEFNGLTSHSMTTLTSRFKNPASALYRACTNSRHTSNVLTRLRRVLRHLSLSCLFGARRVLWTRRELLLGSQRLTKCDLLVFCAPIIIVQRAVRARRYNSSSSSTYQHDEARDRGRKTRHGKHSCLYVHNEMEGEQSVRKEYPDGKTITIREFNSAAPAALNGSIPR